MKNIFFFPTQIGIIGIAEQENKITNVFFETDKISGKDILRDKSNILPEEISRLESNGFYINRTEVLREAERQLDEYLKGGRKVFDLPMSPEGTEFMQSVWKCLCGIPYGQTRTYGEIAEAAGNIKACRAVGMANNRNPIPIFIPCHRVVGANGKLTGYRGGLTIKQKLLELERCCKR
ncbi:MAG TPA: methylated-DNA--[protein]-cysteine S-methyltransferase [Ruminiclostridium sp.]|nr:methylated-DNA--[protein]-cysteine S-methyltransferase [Ruminiclostridium sp.]